MGLSGNVSSALRKNRYSEREERKRDRERWREGRREGGGRERREGKGEGGGRERERGREGRKEEGVKYYTNKIEPQAAVAYSCSLLSKAPVSLGDLA